MKKVMFRQMYATDGEIKVVKDKVEDIVEEPVVVKEEKKEVKRNGRKHII